MASLGRLILDATWLCHTGEPACPDDVAKRLLAYRDHLWSTDYMADEALGRRDIVERLAGRIERMPKAWVKANKDEWGRVAKAIEDALRPTDNDKETV